jgi:ribonucleoside-diphosphate reductase beta chain
MKSLFNKRDAYKPFWYPWAYEAFVVSEQTHWLGREVSLGDDLKDWAMKLNPAEKNLLTQIFRFFTQADVDVASGYIDKYLPAFKPPEVRMMLTSIAAREGVHIQAYSMLIDELGMPETEYSAFLEYDAMKDKHELLFSSRSGITGLALDIVTFSVFGEGLQLFASFIMLLNFTRVGRMRGMGQIVSWSIRDETHHVDCMVKVFHQLLEEEPYIVAEDFVRDVYAIARKTVELEDRFIDLAFTAGESPNLTVVELKLYIRWIADCRLQQLGWQPIYGVSKNPLPWVDFIVFGKEHVNFFENRPTTYAKGAMEGNWDDAFDSEGDCV